MRNFMASMVLSVWGLFLASAVGWSQTITLTGPTTPVTVADGDDFATDALAHPWDMNRLRDVAWDVGYAQPTTAGGVWQGRNINTMAYYQPLFQGLSDTSYMVYFSRYDEGTPYGELNPIDAGTYTRLSMRTSLPAGARSFTYGFWTTDSRLGPLWDGFGLEDTKPAVEGFRMYDVDLTGATWLQGKQAALAPGLMFFGTAWQGWVKGFMMRPALAPPLNTTHKVDWVRLYNPVTSPRLTLTWNTASVPNDGYHGVNLYVDTDAAGFDGDLFVSGIANSGSYVINTAALPPGGYNFYLKVARLQGGAIQELATSGYSARLVVRAPPAVTIQAPSFTSGEDYATAALGNAWDLSSSADVESLVDVALPSYANGQLSAYAGATDPQVYLNVRKAGAIVPIDPKKYRYFTFRMRVDETGFLNCVDRVANGWVTRLIWWNAGVSTDSTVSKDIPLLEGWHRYTIDMWDPAFVETRGTHAGPQLGWRALSQVRTMRLDPLEVYKTTRFELDDVTLCAENKPVNGSFTVRWTLSDADSAICDVDVFYGYETASGYVEHPTPLVQRRGVAPGPDSYTWNMAQMPNGRYFLRVEARDSVNRRSFMTEVPIIVEGSYPRMNISGMDPTIYYRPKGWWLTLHADGSGYDNIPWGHRRADPVAADYDGDGLMDCAVFHAPSGNWYIRQSSDGQQMGGGPIGWGWSAVKPVPADYDGDGKADLAVFEPAQGLWYIRQSRDGQMLGGAPQAWGWNGVTPVPADYDGDGKADLAVFDPAQGLWYIRQSRDGQMLGGAPQAWGWSGVTPVPADYDGDRRTDLAVFYPAQGMWYVRLSSSGAMLGGGPIQFGATGYVPVPGDFDNDGRADIAVFSPADGSWSFRFSGGGTETAGPWGWNGNNSVPVAGEFYR